MTGKSKACQDPRSKIIAHQFVQSEKRYVLLGRATTSGKYLRIVYTLRLDWTGEQLLRPISAVEMSASQRRQYQKK
jgi:uncharacterized DUF497 family protein